MTAGSWIKNRAERYKAHGKRDTCQHYTRYSAGCAIHKTLACARCTHHKPKKVKIKRSVEAAKRKRDTCKRYNPESVSCSLYKTLVCRRCVGYVTMNPVLKYGA